GLSEPLDLIILTTKSTTLNWAVEAFLPALAVDGCFMTVQNGLAALDLIAKYGEDKIVAGCVMWGSSMPEPGRYAVTAKGPFVVGGLEGRDNRQAAKCRQALKAAFPVQVSPDMRDVLWAKLTITASLTSLGAITGLRFGEMLKRRNIRDLILRVGSEVVTVGRASGVEFAHSEGGLNVNLLVGDGFPPQWIRHLLIRAIGLKHRRTESSMAASISMGRPTEIDLVNGVVVELGKKYDIQAPVNEAIIRVVRELENGSSRPGPESYEMLTNLLK
ncbi:MAG: 2-dehydropantoate 2-reductase, partial [Spirochaetales bacterium]|nr:2-dehydropantoate 2-reductase [Spirochaetales bacterium]